MFEDEVYVFTPRGDIKVLPKGATPIDFAYAIHAEVGHRMIGCKINSKMMPIATPLENGDIVDIMTSETPKGPSRDWLKFIKSSSAKTKIQQWFKKEQREENIVKGKEILEKEIKRIGMTTQEIYKTNYIDVALARYKYNSLDDMYASVGFGAISPMKIIARMLEEYRKEHKEADIEEKIVELTQEKRIKTKPSKTGIIVEGIDNCLVKLSKCCNPVPGDEIIGYITKGRGVSVHRADCINISNLLSEEGRMIGVQWANEEKASYTVDIEVFANDRLGLLADILREVQNTKNKVLAINAKTNKDRVVVIEFTVEVSSLDSLNNVLKVTRKIDSVYEVKRKK